MLMPTKVYMVNKEREKTILNKSNTVTVSCKPSGTIATMLPTPNTIESNQSTPVAMESTKTRIPTMIPTADILLTNCMISFCNTVNSVVVDDANRAVFPSIVRSPVAITMPIASPSKHNVPI